MATIIFPIVPFSMVSGWLATYLPSGAIRYDAPKQTTVRKIIDISALPYGCEITAATLTFDGVPGYTGGVIKCLGNSAETQDVKDLIRPNSVGNYTGIVLEFSYRANGGSGTPNPSVASSVIYSTASIRDAQLTVEYIGGEGANVDETKYRLHSLAPSRDIKPRATIIYPSGTKQPIPADQIIRFTINEGIKSGILLGAVSSSSLELRLSNEGGQWNPGGAMRGTRTPLGARLAMELGILMDGEWAYQPAGVYNIESFIGKATDPAVTFKGYDDMAYGFEKKFVDALTYPVTLSQILSHISEQAGIGYIGGLAANGNVSIPQKPEWGDGCTLRQALSWVCQAGASFGQVNRSGLLTIRPTWGASQHLSITAEHYFDNTHDERILVFNGVVVHTSANEEIKAVADPAIGLNQANTIEISKNPLFVSGQYIAQDMADGIRDALSGGRWQSAEFRWRGDPTVMIGCNADILERSGSEIITTICNQALKWDQGFSMDGKCAIDIGRDFASLGYDEATIGGLPAGTKIRITEASGSAFYTIVSSNYSGSVLLWRDDVFGSCPYRNQAPTNAYENKYAGSSLDLAMQQFGESLPDEVKNMMLPVNVTTRKSAADASPDLLLRSCFALSARELGLSTDPSEGDMLAFLGTLNADKKYWTREAVPGMQDYAYSVSTAGERRNDPVRFSLGMRPAIAIYKNTAVSSIGGGFAPVILPKVWFEVSESGEIYIHGATFAQNDDGSIFFSGATFAQNDDGSIQIE